MTHSPSLHRQPSERSLTSEPPPTAASRGLTGPAVGAVDEVALLDRAGVIVAVNPAWERFRAANDGDPALCGVGSSYLDACRGARDPAAARVAAAVHAALSGDLPAPVPVLVACDSPTEPRWFDVLVASRYDDAGRCLGATVVLRLRDDVVVDDPAADLREPGSGEEGGNLALHDSLVSEVFATGMALASVVEEITDERARLRVADSIDALDDVIKHLRATVTRRDPST